LLEVLVAFSILAVSLGILFQIYSKGAYSARLADDYANAIMIAQSRLSNIGIESLPDVGIYEDSNERFDWVTRIKPVEDLDEEDKRQNLIKREVEIEVSWQSKGGIRSVKLNTLKLFTAT
jgi:general secretion pathway protein I